MNLWAGKNAIQTREENQCAMKKIYKWIFMHLPRSVWFMHCQKSVCTDGQFRRKSDKLESFPFKPIVDNCTRDNWKRSTTLIRYHTLDLVFYYSIDIFMFEATKFEWMLKHSNQLRRKFNNAIEDISHFFFQWKEVKIFESSWNRSHRQVTYCCGWSDLSWKIWWMIDVDSHIWWIK